MDRLMGLPEHTGIGDFKEPKLLFTCVFAGQGGKTWWSCTTYPLFQLGAIMRIRGGKNHGKPACGVSGKALWK